MIYSVWGSEGSVVTYSVRVRGVCSDIQCEGQRGL